MKLPGYSMRRSFVTAAAFAAPLFFLLPHLVYAQAAPFAATLGPTFLTENSVRLNARVNSNETDDTQYWFEWGFSGASITYVTERRSVGKGISEVNQQLIGLHPDTTYFARVIAENSRGRDTGQTTYFTTKSLLVSPEEDVRVRTLGMREIHERRVVVEAYVSPHMNSRTTWWFEYGEGAQLNLRTQENGIGDRSEVVTREINNLRPGLLHSYRIVGQSMYGRQYGEVKTFRTQGTPLTGSETIAFTTGVFEGNDRRDPEFTWDLPDVWEGQLTVLLSENGGPYKEIESRRVPPKGSHQVSTRGFREGVRYLLRANIDFQGRVYQSAVTSVLIPKTVSGSGNFDISTQRQQGEDTLTPYDMRTAPPAIAYTNMRIANPFAALFGGFGNGDKSDSGATKTRATSSPTNGNENSSADEQLASVGAGSGIFSFLRGGTPKDEVTLLTSSEGDRKPHSTMEYTIRYANNTKATLSGAILKIIFPKNVIYIGDNTSNEFLVEENSGSGERTYVLNVGDLKPGDGRTITMLGMLTSDTGNPNVRARLYYRTGVEEKVLASSPVSREDILRSEQGLSSRDAKQEDETSASSRGGWTIFPTTLLGWVIFSFLAALIIVGGRKLHSYYLLHKEQLEEEEQQLRTSRA